MGTEARGQAAAWGQSLQMAFLRGFVPAPSCNSMPSGTRVLELHVRAEGLSWGTSGDAAGVEPLSGSRQWGEHLVPTDPARGAGSRCGVTPISQFRVGFAADMERFTQRGWGAGQWQGPFAPSLALLPPWGCPRPAPLNVRIRCSKKIQIFFPLTFCLVILRRP